MNYPQHFRIDVLGGTGPDETESPTVGIIADNGRRHQMDPDQDHIEARYVLDGMTYRITIARGDYGAWEVRLHARAERPTVTVSTKGKGRR